MSSSPVVAATRDSTSAMACRDCAADSHSTVKFLSDAAAAYFSKVGPSGAEAAAKRAAQSDTPDRERTTSCPLVALVEKRSDRASRSILAADRVTIASATDSAPRTAAKSVSKE